MHPSKEMLEKFIRGLIEDEAIRDEIRDHVEKCEFCGEYCEEYGRFLKSAGSIIQDGLPPEAIKQEEKLFRGALSGRIIPLRSFMVESDNEITYLAADGEEKQQPRVQNLATLYSENPEIVLRLMRDLDNKLDYLQVVSDDPEMADNVMIQLPDIDREFVTDKTGRATLENMPAEDWEKLNWQIKMPDAIFSLEPLAYDPDRVESSSQTILETAGGDRLKVVFEKRTEGGQVSMQLLELKGNPDFGAARVIVSSESGSVTDKISPDQTVSMGPIDLSKKINIRFFCR